MLNEEQSRVLQWRMSSGDVAALIGPPGSGKTTTGAMLATRMIAENMANRVLLVAYTNAAADEFGWELCKILHSKQSIDRLCIRTGNAAAVDPLLPIPFSNQFDEIRTKKIVICTTRSLKRLSYAIRFENTIIDEAGIEKLEDLLAPLQYGVNQMTTTHFRDNPERFRIDNLMELISQCGIVATVVGDPKQSRPIGLTNRDSSAIEWVIKRARSDILNITHRLPDKLSGLVNEFARYGGLRSAQEIAMRRLTLNHVPDIPYREIIEPDEVVTWVDMNGTEEEVLASSWLNDHEARACAKICNHLRTLTNKSIVVVTRFTGQKMQIRNYLKMMGIPNIRVTTTTGALGTQSDIVIFSLVRNNPERIVGAAGTLQDLNVAISRSKEKLIILGNFEMMFNGWSGHNQYYNYWRKSNSRALAQLIDSKYGRVINTPPVIRST
jgi:hypothetical protein